jgi:hypothetical protein
MIFVAVISSANASLLVSIKSILTGFPFVGPFPSMATLASITVSCGLKTIYNR